MDDSKQVQVAVPESVPVKGSGGGGGGGGGGWFTPAQIALVGDDQLPTAVPANAEDYAPEASGEQTQTAGAAIDFGDGSLPFIPHARSPARVAVDKFKRGVKSSDEEVLNSREALAMFFNHHNTRPYVVLQVHGYHEERRHSSSAGGSGWDSVTDFLYNINLSNYIHPLGKIMVVSKDGKPASAMLDEFLTSSNGMQSLQMTKHLVWPTNTLEQYVRDHIRNTLGWRQRLTVTTELYNRSVRICKDSRMSSCWDDPCLRCLAVVTILPAIVMSCYGKNKRESGLASAFTIQRSPEQVMREIVVGIHVNKR